MYYLILWQCVVERLVEKEFEMSNAMYNTKVLTHIEQNAITLLELEKCKFDKKKISVYMS